MSLALSYAIAGVLVFCLGLFALVVRRHLLYKILALNVAGSGAFLVYVALAYRQGGLAADPVPQAMVLTGIVVAVSTSALGLVMALRLYHATGHSRLPEEESR